MAVLANSRQPWFCCAIAMVMGVSFGSSLFAQDQQAAAIPGAEPVPEVRREPGGGFGAVPLPERRPDDPGSQTQQAPTATTVSAEEGVLRNTPDVGDLLSKSAAGTGVEIQYRAGVISDPRVRGYHVGQLVTEGDGGYWLPARQDLDTAVSKFDPGSIGDVIVLKGPYSVRYGPGFAFVDIATLNSPRSDHGFDWGGRTLFGYQTNGARWAGLQSVWAADANWGFRATYDIRTGDDYRAGNDQIVPGSYNSQNVTYAFGFDISPDSRIEFKGLRLFQHDLAFPGLFFDISQLNTEAYSLRYILENMTVFDRFTFDVWYNGTTAQGDTTRGSKQRFLNSFLSSGNVFNEPIQDFSSTNFNEESRGYRAAFNWGQKDSIQVAIGTDLNVVNQALAENIRLLQLDMNNPAFISSNPLTADLGIPPAQLVDPGIFIDTSVPVTERVNVKGGFRADWVTTTSHEREVTGNVAIIAGRTTVPPFPGEETVIRFNPIVFSTSPNDTNLTRQFDLWSAYVNADYKIDEHLTVLGGFGYAQRPPTLTELYAAGPFIALLQQGLVRTIGDPHLSPESLKQFDVGLKANYEGFRGGINGFYAWINNYITFDNAFGFLQNAAGNQISQVVFTNTDVATLAGGELYSEVDATSWLTPFALVSYVQGRDLTHADNRRPANSGVPFVGAIASSRRAGSPLTALSEPLPGISPLELRWGLRVHQPDAPPRWAVEFGARSVLAQNLVASSLNEQETPGFTVLDFRAFWQVNNYLLVTGGVENFNDKSYREHLDPRAGDQLFRPGTNFYTTAELKY